MDLIQHMLSPGSEHKSLTHTHTLTQSGSITTGFITLLVPAYHLHACTQKTSDFKATVAAAHCQPCFHTEGDGPLKHVAQSPNPQLLATRWWWNAAVHHNQRDWADCYMTQDSWGYLIPGDHALGLQFCWCNSLLESGRWWDWTSRMPQSVVLVARLSHNPASLTFSTKGACFVPWKRYHNIRCQRLQRPTGQLWHLWRVTRTITTHKIHFKFNTKSVQQFWASIFIFRLYSVHFYVLWWLVPLPFFRCVVQDGPIPNLYL